MRKLFTISVTVLVSLAFTACGDSFLTVESNDSKFLEDYFKTEEHLQEALIAAYDPLEWFDWAAGQYNPLNIMSDIMADQIWVGGESKTDNQFWHLMMNYEAIPDECMGGIWSDAYSGVKRCNDVLTYMDWVPELSAETAKSIEAQVRVLRAYYYMLLWKFWGNIPYYEVNLTGDFTCEQFPADEVYAKFIADLEGAIALGALPMKRSGEEMGRVTLAMAYMVYAEAVLYQNDESRMPKALDYMKEIISSGQYALLDDYGTIFKEEGEWQSESIFEINYKSVGGQRYYSWVRGAGGTILPRLISPYGWSGDSEHDSGWGFAPVRKETLNLFDEADARRAATCWVIPEDKRESYTHRYQDTGIFLEKYVAYKANGDTDGDSDMRFNNNLRIYRYAETLLNAAELVQRGFGGGDAAAWLNAVHGRSLAGQTVSLSLENIKEERRMEFVGEGKRYWDLVRWGDAPTVLVPDSYGYRTNAWTASKKYLPFPQSEMDATEGKTYQLVQNNY